MCIYRMCFDLLKVMVERSSGARLDVDGGTRREGLCEEDKEDEVSCLK